MGPLDEVLAAAKIEAEPMAQQKGTIFLRRSHTDGKSYFIANHAMKPLDAWITLGTPAESVATMDPLSGTTQWAWTRKNVKGQCEVRLYMEPGQSIILRTFDIPSAQTLIPPVKPGEVATTLTGAWNVQFITGGPELPEPWKPETLVSWSKGDDAKRDAFSGTARYTIQFDFKSAKAGDWILDLGEVLHTARITINEMPLGTAIMHPYRIVIPSGLLRKQGNKLEIEVTNLGANRLRDLDVRKMPWKTFYFVDIAYHPMDASSWPIAPSGLLGPVTLRLAIPVTQ